MLKPLSDSEFNQEVRENVEPIIIMFTGSWCQPCKRFKPTVAEMSQNFPDIRFAEMDIEHSQETVSHLNIRTVPSLALFVDGMVREVHSGTMNKTELRLWIQENI
jgi:thioredoxin-like negative regulator of GroEL